MAIDTYAPCPGGTGKKIKFCCADLVGDLEQLDRLIEGDQLAAALEHVERLSQKHPGRACLFATRGKLELAAKQFPAAAATARAFVEAFPENPLALGQSAVSEAIAGRMQEAAGLFDKARAAARSAAEDVSPELVRIAATLVQVAAQLGHVGLAQGIVEWLVDRGLGSAEERRMLAAFVGSSGVPPALRTKVRLVEAGEDTPWRAAFDAALGDARQWRLTKALAAFRGLKTEAGRSRALFTNVAVLCEMMALPYEAAEAWLAVARMDDVAPDDAEEATGRAIALETEADPDRSPQIRFASLASTLVVPAGEEGVTALDLLEDRLRHDPRCDPAAFDRGTWTSRNAVPPRSVWRIYSAADGPQAARLLATLLIFGRQTDREPEAILQGFEPDVAEARPAVEAMIGGSFAAPEGGENMPAVGPTAWLMGAQFRLRPDDLKPAGGAADETGLVDLVLDRQRAALWGRFLDVWPDTPLPELLGRTPRQAVGDAAGRQRVAALVTEGEATSRQRDASDAWASVRGRLGLPGSAPIVSERPLQEVPPMRWHRLDLDRLPLDQLRAVFGTALDAGFERAAERAAEAIVARGDAAPEDRWEALGLLEDRALSGRRKLEIITELRAVAKALKAGDGMLDVAELRIRLQRGDQVETAKLLDHLRREHSRDQQVLQALAEVLMEAGIDLTALAGRDAAAGAVPGMGGAPAAAARSPAAATDQGRIWTPGGEQPPGGEKKAIWTPG